MKEIPNFLKAVALALKEAREEAGISQRRLAEKMNCSRAYIDSVEREKYQPTLCAFMLMAREIGIPEEDLLRRVKCNLTLLNSRGNSNTESYITFSPMEGTQV